MANQNNFKDNIQELSQQYIKFSVSRVIENKSDDLLQMEVPADFESQILNNNIEVNIYSLADNSLIYSDFISNSITGAVTVESLQYTDGTLRNLLYIDFSKLTDLILPLGQFSVSLNFFSDEVGSYDNRSLKITNISPSRTEVELESEDVDKLKSFALPALNTMWTMDAMKQVFNQTGSQNSNIPTIKTALSSSQINAQLPANTVSSISTYGFDEGDDNVYSIAQDILNIAYTQVQQSISQRMTSDRMRFTDKELNELITYALSSSYSSYANNNMVKLSQLPYTLVTGD
jgi:hypothetical protein